MAFLKRLTAQDSKTVGKGYACQSLAGIERALPNYGHAVWDLAGPAPASRETDQLGHVLGEQRAGPISGIGGIAFLNCDLCQMGAGGKGIPIDGFNAGRNCHGGQAVTVSERAVIDLDHAVGDLDRRQALAKLKRAAADMCHAVGDRNVRKGHTAEKCS